MVDYNLTGVEAAQSYTIMPEGLYQLKITAIKEDKTANFNTVWQTSFKVVTGKFKGRNVRDNIIFTEKAKPKIMNLYQSIGGFDLAKKQNFQPVDLLNKYIDAELIIEKYLKDGDEKKINKIAYGGYSETTLTKDQIADFEKELKQKAQKAKAKAKADDEDDIIGEDEIPF